jgi:hypothetical protein
MHFASRRLRKEAGPELEQLHQSVGTLMGSLVRVSKRSVLDIEREKEQVVEKLQSEEARNVGFMADLEKAKAEIEARDRLIASLRAQTSMSREG